jgi:hypothetical protein
MSFLKKGKAAHAALEKAEAQAEAAAKNRAFRFWLPDKGQTSITFLDGDLDADGMLDIPMYYEHQVFMNGHYRNWFACVAEDEPCPICEGGDTPMLVGCLTVIDHSEFKDKQGKVRKDEKRLFVAKRKTIQQLQLIAAKRGGLTGCLFDVARTGDKEANVGNMFDFTEKVAPAQLKKKYKENAEPFEYEEVIPHPSAKELRALGFGTTGVGGEQPPSDSEGTGEEYANDL